jgi:transposase
VHDVTQAEPWLEDIPAKPVVADQAYDSKPLIDLLHARATQTNIPPRAGNHYPRDCDAHDSKTRHWVERFFNRINPVRRIATRYEKLDVAPPGDAHPDHHPDMAGLNVNTT